jgi:hypothetical protein
MRYDSRDKSAEEIETTLNCIGVIVVCIADSFLLHGRSNSSQLHVLCRVQPTNDRLIKDGKLKMTANAVCM